MVLFDTYSAVGSMRIVRSRSNTTAEGASLALSPMKSASKQVSFCNLRAKGSFQLRRSAQEISDEPERITGLKHIVV